MVTTLKELTPDPKNRRRHTSRNVEMITEAIASVGTGRSIVIDEDDVVLAGNATVKAAGVAGLTKLKVVEAAGDEVIAVRRRGLSSEQKRALAIYDNRTAELAEWDVEQLVEDVDAGLDLGAFFEPVELDELLPPPDVEGLTDPDAVPEPRATDIKTGDLFTLGDHRLLCGDSTKAEDVARVMDGATVPLVHADPPYGMGKDGVVNDNLYREKLDAFQMAWWLAVRPYLEDNASAYVWGNAEDLWRLWYVGGLRDSERLTVRNEIVWDKKNVSGLYAGNGIGSEIPRSFANISERCLFFMLGEQGFNNNADNYWEGWESVRSSLATECQKMGWGAKDIERICGVGMYSHWFTKSQWTFIPEEHYRKLQAAAREHDAFKREHDDLKREFYATRSFFNNTHDNMTDVWEFPRVTGEDRHGHATPKPVAMVARAIKSSTPEKGAVVDPFCGSGTTIIAAEQLGRKCYAIEIEPSYCQVTIDRWEAFTGKTATQC